MNVFVLMLLAVAVFSLTCVCGCQSTLNSRIKHNPHPQRGLSAKAIYWAYAAWGPLVGTVTLFLSFGLFAFITLLWRISVSPIGISALFSGVGEYLGAVALYFLLVTALAYISSAWLSALIGLISSLLFLKSGRRAILTSTAISSALGFIAALVIGFSFIGHLGSKGTHFEQIMWPTSWIITSFLVFFLPGLLCSLKPIKQPIS
jgi:hypothetical protein